jgi:hypothetical protein
MAQVNLPGNSHKSKAPQVKKEVVSVTKGRVRTKKPALGKRFMNSFFGEDAGGVWHYIGWEVLMPAAKDTITDVVSQGIERLLYGEARGRGRGRGGNRYSNGPVTNYTRYSSSGPIRSEPRMEISRRGRATHDFDELVFESRADAEGVIDGLYDILSQYEEATVSDLYELSGVSGNFTDQKWGWTDLKGAGVSKRRDGYYLDLPRPTPLD